MTEEVATQLLGAFVEAGFREDEILKIIDEPNILRRLHYIVGEYGLNRDALLARLSSHKVHGHIFMGYHTLDPSIRQILGFEDIRRYIDIAVGQLSTHLLSGLMSVIERSYSHLTIEERKVLDAVEQEVIFTIRRIDTERKAQIDTLAAQYGVRLPLNDERELGHIDTRTFKALTKAGYRDCVELTTITESALRKIKGVGPGTITQLTNLLGCHGLSFKVASL